MHIGVICGQQNETTEKYGVNIILGNQNSKIFIGNKKNSGQICVISERIRLQMVCPILYNILSHTSLTNFPRCSQNIKRSPQIRLIRMQHTLLHAKLKIYDIFKNEIKSQLFEQTGFTALLLILRHII